MQAAAAEGTVVAAVLVAEGEKRAVRQGMKVVEGRQAYQVEEAGMRQVGRRQEVEEAFRSLACLEAWPRKEGKRVRQMQVGREVEQRLQEGQMAVVEAYLVASLVAAETCRQWVERAKVVVELLGLCPG